MITILEKVLAYTLSFLHYRTIWKTLIALEKGTTFSVIKILAFINAKDKTELLATNPTLHERVTGRRRIITSTLFVLWLFVLAVAWIHRPIGLAAFVLWHAVILFLIGRTDPVLNRVQTSRMMGEALIRKVFNEVVLPLGLIKSGEATTTIVNPPTRIKKGYEVTVRVPDSGVPDKVFTKNGKAALAHKLQKDKTEIYTYKIRGDESLIRLVVLDKDPWSLPPSENPLVKNPRRVNLWRDQIDLGVYADSTPYRKLLVEKGDGGGVLAGGAPRRGKTNWLANLIVAILLDPTANLNMIDGKAVDFESIKDLCRNFIGDPDLEDEQLLAMSIALLKELKKEVNRRRKILLTAKVGHVSEEICKKYGFGLEFLIIDELAVLTTDLMTHHKALVLEFREILGWLVRMGPAFGVFCVLATQRPSNTSVPDEIRSMIIWRIAFYVSSVTASQAILGKAGPAYRADWLDPDQKGVAICIGEGQLRPHLVATSDLEKVGLYAKVMRAAYRPDDNSPIGATHPEPVKTILEIFQKTGQTQLETSSLLDMLQNAGFEVNTVSLARSLKPFGITPTRFRVDGRQTRGYEKSQLEAVPKVVTPKLFESSQPDSETGSDGPEDGYRDGLAANQEEQ